MILEPRSLKETVKGAYSLKPEDFEWNPYRPNNMLCNPVEGYYCLMLNKDKSGTVSGRKYTILFQYKRDKKGYRTKELDRYIFFEKAYGHIVGRTAYLEPSQISGEDPIDDDLDEDKDGDTLDDYDINDFGRFIYAFETMEEAKAQAFKQYQAVYGYAMAHLLNDEDLREVIELQILATGEADNGNQSDS